LAYLTTSKPSSANEPTTNYESIQRRPRASYAISKTKNNNQHIPTELTPTTNRQKQVNDTPTTEPHRLTSNSRPKQTELTDELTSLHHNNTVYLYIYLLTVTV